MDDLSVTAASSAMQAKAAMAEKTFPNINIKQNAEAIKPGTPEQIESVTKTESLLTESEVDVEKSGREKLEEMSHEKTLISSLNEDDVAIKALGSILPNQPKNI